MPPRSNNLPRLSQKEGTLQKPPEPMTWSRAMPILVTALIFDALRFLFTMFWFFGPALAALYCTSSVNGALGTTVGGVAGKIVAGGCSVTAGVAGYLTAPALETFGIVMAMAVGLLGWMIIGLIFLLTNPRGLKENTGNILWFVASLLLSEIPFIDAVPTLSVTMAKLYYSQIRKEKADWASYQEASAAEEQALRNQRVAAFFELQQAQAQEQENRDLAQEEIDRETQDSQEEEPSEEIPDTAQEEV